MMCLCGARQRTGAEFCIKTGNISPEGEAGIDRQGVTRLEHEEFAVRLAEVEARSKSNTHRLDEMDNKVDTLQRLTTAVEVMAAEQKHQTETMAEIKTDVTALGQKVDVIEKKPGKRWEGIVEKAVWAVCAAVIAFLLAKIGL